MNDAYTYAENQFLGTAFDPFTYEVGGRRYVWHGRVGSLLALLVRLGLRSVARLLFARLVEVR